jgi:hypothetical protein
MIHSTLHFGGSKFNFNCPTTDKFPSHASNGMMRKLMKINMICVGQTHCSEAKNSGDAENLLEIFRQMKTKFEAGFGKESRTTIKRISFTYH